MKRFVPVLTVFYLLSGVLSGCSHTLSASNEETKKDDIADPRFYDKEWEIMALPGDFHASSVAFGEKGEIVLIGSDIRISKDNGVTWKVITQGRGFNRLTLDGGRTYKKDDSSEKYLKPDKAEVIKVNDVVYNGDVRNPVFAQDGRLYFSTFYEHHIAVWSVPIEKRDDLWYGLHFTYEDLPENVKFWTTDEILTLKGKIFISAASSEDGTYRWLTTDDHGKSWRKATEITKPEFSVDKDSRFRISGLEILATTDSGKSWRIVRSPKTPDSTFSDYFVDDKTGFAVGDKGLLAVTKDGGKTWRKVDAGTDETLYVVSALDEKNAWAAGGSGLILETRDGGENWSQIKLEGIENNIYSTFFGQELKIDRFYRRVWIIKDGKIYRKIVE